MSTTLDAAPAPDAASVRLLLAILHGVRPATGQSAALEDCR